MKRILTLSLAALLVCLFFFGCNRDTAQVDQPTVLDPTASTANPWDILADDNETTTESAEQTDPTGGITTSGATGTKLVTTTAKATTKTTKATTTAKATTKTTKATTTAKATTKTTKATTTAKATTKTTKATTTAKATTATTKATTTTAKATTTTQSGSFGIAGKDAALQAFNSAVGKAVSGRAGFAKRHMVTYQGWKYDPGLLSGLNISLVNDVSNYLSGQLNSVLNNGVRTASNQKGSASGLIKNSTLAMGDLRDVTYAKSGGDWTVTLLVKGGETRRQKGSTGYTGTAPIAKGPLNHAISDGTVYDHMTADRIFNLIKNQLRLLQADPIDISESTANTKIVAVLGSSGQLKSMTVTYDQTINIRAIKFLTGNTTFRDNTGSSSVTITYDSFLY